MITKPFQSYKVIGKQNHPLSFKIKARTSKLTGQIQEAESIGQNMRPKAMNGRKFL